MQILDESEYFIEHPEESLGDSKETQELAEPERR